MKMYTNVRKTSGIIFPHNICNDSCMSELFVNLVYQSVQNHKLFLPTFYFYVKLFGTIVRNYICFNSPTVCTTCSPQCRSSTVSLKMNHYVYQGITKTGRVIRRVIFIGFLCLTDDSQYFVHKNLVQSGKIFLTGTIYPHELGVNCMLLRLFFLLLFIKKSHFQFRHTTVSA